MKLRALIVLGGLLALAGSASAATTTLGFDDLPSPIAPNTPVPPSYGGLIWNHIDYLNAASAGGGYANGVHSADNVAYNEFGASASVTDGTFDFNSAYLGAAWNDNLEITVEGYKPGSVTADYTSTVTVSTDDSTQFVFDYFGINRLEFSITNQGSPHGFTKPNGDPLGEGTNFVLDDFTFTKGSTGIPGAPLPGAASAGVVLLTGVATVRRRRRA